MSTPQSVAWDPEQDDPAPQHSFALRLDADMALRLRELHHADELYGRVAADRAHLGRWFGWARTADMAFVRGAVRRGLEQFAAGDGWQADLCWRGEVVGSMWLHFLHGPGGSTEVGFWLASQHEGKGLVTRALVALLRHLFDDRGLGRVVIGLDPRNERSLAVVERLGLEPEAVLRSAYRDPDGSPGDLAFYGVLRERWLERSGPGTPSAGAHTRAPRGRFSLRVDRGRGLYLGVLEREDAAGLADLVTANDAYLRPWFPWLDGARPGSQLAFIEQRALPALARGDGFECGLYVDGRQVGMVGVHGTQRPSGRGEIGYWIDAAEQGKGYVTTAVSAVVARAFTLPLLDGEPYERLDVLAEVDNARSRAVAERLGFTFEGVLRRHRHNGTRFADFAVYSLLRGEWLARRAAEGAAVPDPAALAKAVPTHDRAAEERALDDALDDSFPASDPPSQTVPAGDEE